MSVHLYTFSNLPTYIGDDDDDPWECDKVTFTRLWEDQDFSEIFGNVYHGEPIADYREYFTMLKSFYNN